MMKKIKLTSGIVSALYFIQEKLRSPFLRGFGAVSIYYGISALVFSLLNSRLSFRYGVFLIFAFLPAILMGAVVWTIASLITIRRVWSRGALLTHAVIFLLLWWLVLPNSITDANGAIQYVDKMEDDSIKLMPTFKNIEDQAKYLSDYQKELESWEVHTDELDIETAFGKTHIISFGNPQGKPLILLHWFYSNSLEWKYMAPFLQERYRIYAVDVMGDMGKSYASNPPKSEIEVSQWFKQVLDSLCLDKVFLCGHSNGGFQAMLISQQIPDKIEKLILLAPAASFSPFNMKFYSIVFRTVLSPNDRNIERFKEALALNANLYSKETTEMLALSFRVASVQLKVLPRVFSDDELSAFKVPTLLILGNEEFIYSPLKSAKRIQKFLPDSKVIMLPDCGHAIPFDAPKQASDAIDLFLSQTIQPLTNN